MPYLVGAGLALCVSLFATVVGFDRDRAFYATVTIVVGSYYSLFAAMAGSTSALGIETGVALLFVLAAAIGFKRGQWLVAAALCGHGVLDLFHARLISNPGVPAWWPAFCMAYDVMAGGYLAILLRIRPPASR